MTAPSLNIGRRHRDNSILFHSKIQNSPNSPLIERKQTGQPNVELPELRFQDVMVREISEDKAVSQLVEVGNDVFFCSLRTRWSDNLTGAYSSDG